MSELTPEQISIVNDMINAWVEDKAQYREAFRKDCKRLLETVVCPQNDLLQDDLREMLRALGIFDGAQPKSSHQVFQESIAEMKRQLATKPHDDAPQIITIIAGVFILAVVFVCCAFIANWIVSSAVEHWTP